MTADLLAKVGHKAIATTNALNARDAAIREASAAGCSLRDIAEAAGVSHQTVSNILNR